MKNDGSVGKSGADMEGIPVPLRKLQMKRYAAAAFMLLGGIAFAVLSGRWKCLLFCLFALWFWYNGISVERQYARGEIHEAHLICTEVRQSLMKNSILLSFMSDDGETGLILRFSGGRRLSDDFGVGGKYVLYYDGAEPANLLAYEHD